MNNVISVYWGTKYPIKFVNILYSMCKRNISGKFNFYCLTDERFGLRQLLFDFKGEFSILLRLL